MRIGMGIRRRPNPWSLVFTGSLNNQLTLPRVGSCHGYGNPIHASSLFNDSLHPFYFASRLMHPRDKVSREQTDLWPQDQPPFPHGTDAQKLQPGSSIKGCL
jgi:hypothetical protein